jgi:uncharacterized protein (UPF0216 family)
MDNPLLLDKLRTEAITKLNHNKKHKGGIYTIKHKHLEKLHSMLNNNQTPYYKHKGGRISVSKKHKGEGWMSFLKSVPKVLKGVSAAVDIGTSIGNAVNNAQHNSNMEAIAKGGSGIPSGYPYIGINSLNPAQTKKFKNMLKTGSPGDLTFNDGSSISVNKKQLETSKKILHLLKEGIEDGSFSEGHKGGFIIPLLSTLLSLQSPKGPYGEGVKKRSGKGISKQKRDEVQKALELLRKHNGNGLLGQALGLPNGHIPLLSSIPLLGELL